MFFFAASATWFVVGEKLCLIFSFLVLDILLKSYIDSGFYCLEIIRLPLPDALSVVPLYFVDAVIVFYFDILVELGLSVVRNSVVAFELLIRPP